MPAPDFLIIGPPKCGTTALYAVLAQHPQVSMSRIKEPYFFAFDGQPPAFVGPGAEHYRRTAITSWDAYQALFADRGEHLVRGEASPLYLTSYQPERTAANIHRRLPDARLIAILRQPAERAYSQFTYRRQQGFEPLADFRQALAAEERRIAANWPPACRYWRNSLYFTHLTPYFALFPREQIRVYLYDDLVSEPQALLADLCAFLGIEPSLLPVQMERINVTTWTRSRLIDWLLRHSRRLSAWAPAALRQQIGRRLRAWNQVKPPPLDPILRRELTTSYRDEIGHLQALISCDLSHWLNQHEAEAQSV
ncbi:MAG: sulfotransferase [Chloroflexota bacterium]|nr:sulfotransferase [Caldilinea sp.]GIK72622.1 MAG: sulfotransferase [Chloroflexota bacterium]